MNKKMIVASLGALVAALTVNGATAEESAITAGVDVGLYSAYVWRGQVLADDPVIQPSLTVSKNGFTINYWGNINTVDDYTGEVEANEADLTVSYATTCPITGAGLTVGLVDYTFPGQTVMGEDAAGNEVIASTYPGTRELFATVAFADVLLSPTLSVYYDFDEADGFYGNFNLSHAFELCSAANLALGFSTGFASANYNSFYFGMDDGQLNDGNVSAAVPIKLGENLTLKPALTYTWLWNDGIKDDAAGIYKDTKQIVGSATLSYAF